MAEEIKREIWLFQRRRVPPIDIVEGSQLTISLELMDYTIPAGATAKAFARPWAAETTYEQTATVDGNTVTFTPPDGFFRPGGNSLQIEINGSKIPLSIDVNCGTRLSDGGDGATPEAVRPLVERAEEAAQKAEDALAAVPGAVQAAAQPLVSQAQSAASAASASATAAAASAESVKASAEQITANKEAIEKVQTEIGGEVEELKANWSAQNDVVLDKDDGIIPIYVAKGATVTMETVDGSNFDGNNLFFLSQAGENLSGLGYNLNSSLQKRTITVAFATDATEAFAIRTSSAKKIRVTGVYSTYKETRYNTSIGANALYAAGVDSVDVIFMNGVLPLCSTAGFTVSGGGGLYLGNNSNGGRIAAMFADIAADIPDYTTWDASSKKFELKLPSTASFGYDFATRKFAVADYTSAQKPKTFVTLYWVYYSQFGGKIFEDAAAHEAIKKSTDRDVDVILGEGTKITNININGFTLEGGDFWYLANMYGHDRTRFMYADIAAQVGDTFASWDADTKTFTLNLNGGEKRFGFDLKDMNFKVEANLNARSNTFVVLHWVYYKKFGGRIAEYAAAQGYLANDGKYLIAGDLQTESFNAAYHTGAKDFASVCKRYAGLFGGDAKNGVAAVDKCEAFLWFTDPHVFTAAGGGIPKMEEYIAQLQKYYNSTPVTFALCGGDWLGNGDTPEMACYKMGYIDGICRSMFGKCYMLVGNHDTNYQGKKDADSATWTTRLPRASIRNLWYREAGRAYYDFEGVNTHFYCFDTGVENQTLAQEDNYGYEQAAWFAESLGKESNAHIVIAAHIYYYNDDTVQPLTELLIQIAAAYNSRGSVEVNGQSYSFAGATGRVEFMMAGHSHKDYTLVDSGIPVVATLDCGNKQSYTADCSFDLVFVDYDNRKIKCIRAGVGEDRTINLDS